MNWKFKSLIVLTVACLLTGVVYANQSEPEQSEALCDGGNYAANKLSDVSENEFLIVTNYYVDEYRLWSLQKDRIDQTLPYADYDQLPADTYRDPIVSPNGHYIAYADPYSTENLNRSVQFVWSTREQLMISSFIWQPDWLHFVGWQDNQTMSFLGQVSGSTVIDLVNLQGEVTDSISLHDLDLGAIDPAPWQQENPPEPLFFLWTAFSPTHNLLVWHRSPETGSQLQGINLDTLTAFLNLQGEDFGKLEVPAIIRSPGTNRPAWSNKGDVFAIPALDGINLALFSPEVGFEQITFFKPTDKSIPVFSPGWSYDDLYISFMVAGLYGNNFSELYLYDTRQEKVLTTGLYVNRWSGAVWSPDRYHFAFIEDYGEAEGLTIVDIEKCEISRKTSTEQEGYFHNVVEWFAIE